MKKSRYVRVMALLMIGMLVPVSAAERGTGMVIYAENSAESAGEDSTGSTTEAHSEDSSEKFTESAGEGSTEKSTESAGEGSTEKATESAGEGSTEKATESAGEGSTEKTTEANSEGATERSTEAETKASDDIVIEEPDTPVQPETDPTGDDDDNDNDNPSPIHMRKVDKSLVLARYRDVQLTLPAKLRSKKVKWRSSQRTIASVNSKGIVRTKHSGACVITATYNGGSYRFGITVQKKADPKLLKSTYSKSNSANRKNIILIGSSSVDYWASARKAFSPYKVMNMGIAGSTTVEWIDWCKDLVLDYRPAAVVIYVGSNDIRDGDGVSGQTNGENAIKLIKKIQSAYPRIPIFYVGICHVWARPNGWGDVDISNGIVKKYTKTRRNVYYIELGSHVLNASGLPNKTYFKSDLIHPTSRGYSVWNKVIGRQVRRIMKDYR